MLDLLLSLLLPWLSPVEALPLPPPPPGGCDVDPNGVPRCGG